MKKSKLIVFALILFTISAIVCGCSAIKKPTVTVEEIMPSGVSLTSTTFNVKVSIDNPNPFGAHLTKIDFNVYYIKDGQDVYLGHGVKKDVSIVANGKTNIIIPVKIENPSAIKALIQLARNGGVTIKVKGTAYLDLKITSFGIPFEQEKVITL